MTPAAARKLLTNAGISDLEAAQLAPYGAIEFYQTSQEADHAAEAMKLAFMEVYKAHEAVKWALTAAGYPAVHHELLEELCTRLLDDGLTMVRAVEEYREAAALRAEEEEAT